MLALRDRLSVLRDRRGFTMVEMMVVLIIIAVLIGVGITFYLRYIENSKITKAKGQMTTMQAALDAFYSEYGSYPNTKNELNSSGVTPNDLTNPDNDIADPDHPNNGVQLAALDPWGRNYEYKVSTDYRTYVLETGYSSIRGTDNRVVQGTGTDGASSAPAEGTAAVTIP